MYYTSPQLLNKITDTNKYRYAMCCCPVNSNYGLAIPKNDFNEKLGVYNFKCIECGLKGRLYLG